MLDVTTVQRALVAFIQSGTVLEKMIGSLKSLDPLMRI